MTLSAHAVLRVTRAQLSQARQMLAASAGNSDLAAAWLAEVVRLERAETAQEARAAAVKPVPTPVTQPEPELALAGI